MSDRWVYSQGVITGILRYAKKQECHFKDIKKKFKNLSSDSAAADLMQWPGVGREAQSPKDRKKIVRDLLNPGPCYFNLCPHNVEKFLCPHCFRHNMLEG